MPRLRVFLAALLLSGGLVIGVNAQPAMADTWGVYCWSTTGSPYVTAQAYASGSTAAAARACAVKLGQQRWGTYCVASTTVWFESVSNRYYMTTTKKVVEYCGLWSAKFSSQGYRNSWVPW